MVSDQLKTLQTRFHKALLECQSLAELEKLKVKLLGKRGELSEVLKGLKDIPAQDRRSIGELANRLKEEISDSIERKRADLYREELAKQVQQTSLDVSLPGSSPHLGHLHVITQTARSVLACLERLGFRLALGPEIESEYYNFDAVNIPQEHPSRDMQDTFFLDGTWLLRTHTSPVQIRSMLDSKPPLQILAFGAVYRSDLDATHAPMFHQIEGLWVDEGIRMSDLKGVLEFLAKSLFGSRAKIRLRPSYFPFVEPGAEVDVSCTFCNQKGCSICKQSGWIEILGAGMVHPHLFNEVGYDAEKYSGFAFGLGVERVALLQHQIPDLRLMYQGDMRFLTQF